MRACVCVCVFLLNGEEGGSDPLCNPVNCISWLEHIQLSHVSH